MSVKTEIVQAESREELDAVRELMREYIAWTHTFAGNPLSAPTFHNVDQEIVDLPGEYVPPRGRLLLATHDGRVAGCVALKPVDQKTGELKRLYVRPEFRRLRIGQQLVRELVDAARDEGYEKIVLDSHRTMTAAHAIYRSAGFHVVPTPSDFPEQFKAVVVFMEYDLVRRSLGS